MSIKSFFFSLFIPLILLLMFFAAGNPTTAQEGMMELAVTDESSFSAEQAFYIGQSLGEIGATTYLFVSGYAHSLGLVPGDVGHDALWKTDGTIDGTYEVTLLPDKFESSTGIGVIDDRLLFSYNNDMYSTDGTMTGTVRLSEYFHFGSWTHLQPTIISNTLYYLNSKDIDCVGNICGPVDPIIELIVTDGTISNTRIITDVLPENHTIPVYTFNDDPINFQEFNGAVYFLVSTESQSSTDTKALWRTDGTTSGTYEVWNSAIYGRCYGYHSIFDVIEDRLVLRACGKLFSMDPSENVAVLIDEFAEISVVDENLFFVNDCDLWVMDGDQTTQKLVDLTKEYISGEAHSCATLLNEINGGILFSPRATLFEHELWVSDGTILGTQKLRTAFRISCFGCGFGIPFADKVFFTDDYFVTDGTVEGTEDLPSEIGGYSVMGDIVFNDVVYLSLVNQRENDVKRNPTLWRTDGTVEGTYIVKRLQHEGRIRFGRTTDDLMILNVTYETADDPAYGSFETYKPPVIYESDGTFAGTNFVNRSDFLLYPQLYLPTVGLE